MKKDNPATKFYYLFVISVGFTIGHLASSWWTLLVMAVGYFLTGYMIAFLFWVMRGWRIDWKGKKEEKFRWHEKGKRT